MEKYKCDCKDTLEDLESELNNLRGVLELLTDYFLCSEQSAEENPHLLANRYSQYGALTRLSIDAVDKILKRINSYV